MTTEELIDKLAGEATPVGHSLPAPVALGVWAGTSAAGMALVNASAFPMRDDLHAAIGSAGFLASLVTLLGVLAFAALDAIRSGRPGAPPAPGLALGARLSLGGFFASLALNVWSGESIARGFTAGANCSYILLVLSILPSAFFLWTLRRLAPVDPAKSLGLAGLAVGAIAAIALTFDCPSNQAAHLVVWHGLPVIGLRFVGKHLGAFLLRW